MSDSVNTPPAVEAEALLDIRMRLSAELGRARMPVAKAVALGGGTIVELDRDHDDPVEIYVNGLHFGSGRLLLVDDEWALRVETLDADTDFGGVPAEPAASAHPDASSGEDDLVEQPSNDGQALPGESE